MEQKLRSRLFEFCPVNCICHLLDEQYKLQNKPKPRCNNCDCGTYDESSQDSQFINDGTTDSS